MEDDDGDITILLAFPEKRGVVVHRDKSAEFKFETDLSQYDKTVRLQSVPDKAIMAVTFRVVEVEGRQVRRKTKVKVLK